MKILSAKVSDRPGTWHRWTLNVHAEEMPDHKSLVYEKRGSLYFAEQDGYVSFHSYRGPDNGFCGATFETPVRQFDGSVVIEKHIGPWSSNQSATNNAGFTPCVTVHWQGSISGHFTLNRARAIVEGFKLPYKYHEVLYNGRHSYYDLFPNDWKCGKYQGIYEVLEET